MAELQMVFYNLEDCQNCITQLNTNLGYPNAVTLKWDDPHKIYNENCIDYLNGLRYYILKPIGGRAKRGLLSNVTEVFNYVELEYDLNWNDVEQI